MFCCNIVNLKALVGLTFPSCSLAVGEISYYFHWLCIQYLVRVKHCQSYLLWELLNFLTLEIEIFFMQNKLLFLMFLLQNPLSNPNNLLSSVRTYIEVILH